MRPDLLSFLGLGAEGVLTLAIYGITLLFERKRKRLTEEA